MMTMKGNPTPYLWFQTLSNNEVWNMQTSEVYAILIAENILCATRSWTSEKFIKYI
jgi:hypothetical protein